MDMNMSCASIIMFFINSLPASRCVWLGLSAFSLVIL